MCFQASFVPDLNSAFALLSSCCDQSVTLPLLSPKVCALSLLYQPKLMELRSGQQNDTGDAYGCSKPSATCSHSGASITEHCLPNSFIRCIRSNLKTYEPLLKAIQMCTSSGVPGCDVTLHASSEKGSMTMIVQPCANVQTSFDHVSEMAHGGQEGMLYSVHGWCVFIKGRIPCQWWSFRWLANIDERDQPKSETTKAIMEYAADSFDARMSVGADVLEDYVGRCSEDLLRLMSPRQVMLLCQLAQSAANAGRVQSFVENMPQEELAAELSEQELREIALERPAFHEDFFNVYMVVPSTPPQFVLQNTLAFLADTVSANVTLRRTSLNLVKSRGFADVVLHLVVDFTLDPLGPDPAEPKLLTLEEIMRVFTANLDPFAVQEEKSPRSLSTRCSVSPIPDADCRSFRAVSDKWMGEEGRTSATPKSRAQSVHSTAASSSSLSLGSRSRSWQSQAVSLSDWQRPTPLQLHQVGSTSNLSRHSSPSKQFLPFEPFIPVTDSKQLEHEVAPIVCSAFLYKSSPSVFKGWHKRWVVIKGEKLVYSKSLGDQIEGFKAVSLKDCVVREHTSKTRPFTFAVQLPSKRTQLWSADDETTFQSFWCAIQAITTGTVA